MESLLAGWTLDSEPELLVLRRFVGRECERPAFKRRAATAERAGGTMQQAFEHPPTNPEVVHAFVAMSLYD